LIFLGTPFRGAPGLTQNEMIQAVEASYTDMVHGEILRILDPDDESLQEIVHTFEKIQGRTPNKAQVACFFEQIPCNVKAIAGMDGKKACYSPHMTINTANWIVLRSQ
jgi:hypothetical protein